MSNRLPMYYCGRCAARFPVEVGRIDCDCGGPLELELVPAARSQGGPPTTPRPLLPVSKSALSRSSLGAGRTALLRWHGDGEVWLKCDHLQPTGSFKDRGAEIMVALALDLGATHLVVDSSGNAGAALAAHAARAGLACTVFTPATTSPGKLRQIACYGARLELVSGPREMAETAARRFARATGALYASHAANPFFLDGTKSWIYEVVSELSDIDSVVVPAGSGSLLLGVVRGLRELLAANWIRRLPQIVVTQAAGFATLDGRFEVSTATATPFAEGIAIRHPVRGSEMRAVVEELDMVVAVVGADSVREAQRELALQGYYVEPTGAAAWAGFKHVLPHGRTVVALTGNGLKTQIAGQSDHPDHPEPEAWRNDAAS